MARRMYDLDNGTENIKVKSLDASLITSNGEKSLEYDSLSSILYIGHYDLPTTYITSENVFIDTDYNGGICLDQNGMTLSTADDTSIQCVSPLTLSSHSTAQRPTTLEGSIIYDTTLKKCILYNGTAWVNLDGTALSS